MLCRGAQVVVEALHRAFVDAAGAAVDDRRQPATAQALIGGSQPADRLLGQWLGQESDGQAKGASWLDWLSSSSAGGACRRSAICRSMVHSHSARVRVGQVEPALFMVGNKVMMRDYIDQQVGWRSPVQWPDRRAAGWPASAGPVPIVAGTGTTGFSSSPPAARGLADWLRPSPCGEMRPPLAGTPGGFSGTAAVSAGKPVWVYSPVRMPPAWQA